MVYLYPLSIDNQGLNFIYDYLTKRGSTISDFMYYICIRIYMYLSYKSACSTYLKNSCTDYWLIQSSSFK